MSWLPRSPVPLSVMAESALQVCPRRLLLQFKAVERNRLAPQRPWLCGCVEPRVDLDWPLPQVPVGREGVHLGAHVRGHRASEASYH